MMGRILPYLLGGAADLVRSYASEAARNPLAKYKRGTSPLTRAVARIRSELRQFGTMEPLDYETARNIFRAAVRQSERAQRKMGELGAGAGGGTSPDPPANPRGPPRMDRYGVLVVVRTPRSGQEYRGQIVVTAPRGTPTQAILDQAVQDARAGQLYSRAGDPRNTPRTASVTRAEILWIEEDR